MTTRAIVLVTIPLFGLFLLVRMPVSMLYEQFVAEKLPGHVEVARLTGSLWNGRAHGIQIRGHRLGDIGWSLEGIGVLGPSLHLAFDARGDHQSRLTGRLSLASLDGRVTLRDIKGTVDARTLDVVLQDLSAKLAGSIELDLARVEVAPGKPFVGSADGQATWSAASVLQPIAVELGNVELQLAPAQETQGIRGRFRNAGGAVAADGSFRLDGDGRYQLDLGVRREDEAADKLEAILEFGKPNADGSRQFSFTGSL